MASEDEIADILSEIFRMFDFTLKEIDEYIPWYIPKVDISKFKDKIDIDDPEARAKILMIANRIVESSLKIQGLMSGYVDIAVGEDD